MLSVGASWRCRAMMLAQLKRVISSNCYKALLIGCLIKLGQKQSSTRVGVKVGICRRFTLMGKGLLAVKWRKSYLPLHSPSLPFSLSPGLGLTCFFLLLLSQLFWFLKLFLKVFFTRCLHCVCVMRISQPKGHRHGAREGHHFCCFSFESFLF